MLFRSLTYLILIIWFSSNTADSQEIPFGDYSSSYSITPLLTGQTLDFGIIVPNEMDVEIPLEESVVIPVEGVRYLDITVDVTIDYNFIFLGGDDTCSDSSCRIPFTLKAAYSNRSDAPNTGEAVIMTGSPGSLSARFPIRSRGNAPPGPPPTPVYEGFNPAIYFKTAYIYIYGNLNVGTHNAGIYSYNLSIEVNYE